MEHDNPLAPLSAANPVHGCCGGSTTASTGATPTADACPCPCDCDSCDCDPLDCPCGC
ncbi:MAG: hypothetical protein K1X88_24085 [Nannocystaceae bacterium]|nr:hypothetical protein [Nannocystaceae bacterium]